MSMTALDTSMETSIKVGDRLTVHNLPQKAVVSRIDGIYTTQEVILHLDWGVHGVSKVKLQDRGNVWRLFTEVN